MFYGQGLCHRLSWESQEVFVLFILFLFGSGCCSYGQRPIFKTSQGVCVKAARFSIRCLCWVTESLGVTCGVLRFPLELLGRAAPTKDILGSLGVPGVPAPAGLEQLWQQELGFVLPHPCDPSPEPLTLGGCFFIQPQIQLLGHQS